MHACCDCAHLPDAEFVAASDARGQTQQKSSAQPRTILDRHFRPFWPTHFRPFRTILDRHFRSFWPSHFRPFRTILDRHFRPFRTILDRHFRPFRPNHSRPFWPNHFPGSVCESEFLLPRKHAPLPKNVNILKSVPAGSKHRCWANYCYSCIIYLYEPLHAPPRRGVPDLCQPVVVGPHGYLALL
jgi:hypothetical protein